MYSLTEQERNLVGLQHQYMNHDCNVDTKGHCRLYTELETAFVEGRNEQEKQQEALEPEELDTDYVLEQ